MFPTREKYHTLLRISTRHNGIHHHLSSDGIQNHQIIDSIIPSQGVLDRKIISFYQITGTLVVDIVT